MQIFEITPHKSVGPIHLGMTRKEVHQILGQPRMVYDAREVYLDGFMVDFDASDQVAFIELAQSTRFKAIFRGKCLHEMPADAAVAFLSQFSAIDKENPEPGYTFVFTDLQMSLWRGVLPEESQPEDDAAGRFFEAVGVAGKGYF